MTHLHIILVQTLVRIRNLFPLDQLDMNARRHITLRNVKPLESLCDRCIFCLFALDLRKRPLAGL
jgi:hypothetical protein